MWVRETTGRLMTQRGAATRRIRRTTNPTNIDPIMYGLAIAWLGNVGLVIIFCVSRTLRRTSTEVSQYPDGSPGRSQQGLPLERFVEPWWQLRSMLVPHSPDLVGEARRINATASPARFRTPLSPAFPMSEQQVNSEHQGEAQ
jgi:hypothetical protein